MKEQADLVDRRNILAALNLGLIDAERAMSLLERPDVRFVAVRPEREEDASVVAVDGL